jgi:hypothetical protein
MNMTFVVEGPDGEEEFSDRTLLIFIDETGHEEFADPFAPFFGFGGCLCPVPTYESWIEGPWSRVETNFPKEMLPLHAAELQPAELTAKQLASISSFFTRRSFQCFAAVVSDQVLNETEEVLYHIMARVTFERVLEMTRCIHEIDFEQIVMIFEHSERTDRMMADYFRRYDLKKRDGSKVPIHHCTMTKKDHIPSGLVVADFVAHTAGAQTRARINGEKKFRRDFVDIFKSVPPELKSFMEITRITLPDG